MKFLVEFNNTDGKRGDTDDDVDPVLPAKQSEYAFTMPFENDKNESSIENSRGNCLIYCINVFFCLPKIVSAADFFRYECCNESNLSYED